MPEDKTANRRIIEVNVDCIDEAKAIARQDLFAINGVAKYDFVELNLSNGMGGLPTLWISRTV